MGSSLSAARCCHRTALHCTAQWVARAQCRSESRAQRERQRQRGQREHNDQGGRAPDASTYLLYCTDIRVACLRGLSGVSASDRVKLAPLTAQTQRPAPHRLAATSPLHSPTAYWCFSSPSIPSSFIDNIHTYSTPIAQARPAPSRPVRASCRRRPARCPLNHPGHALGPLERRCIAPAVPCALTHSKHLISSNQPFRHPFQAPL